MRKKNSRNLLTMRKSSIAQLNENQAGNLNGGSSSLSTTFTISTSLDDNCGSLFCVPPL